MGNYYINRAETLSNQIKSWDCKDIAELHELLMELENCSESAEKNISDYLPENIPTIWNPDSTDQKIWAVDIEGKGLSGSEISYLKVINFQYEMQVAFRERCTKISDNIKNWDCRDINELYKWINELKEGVEICSEELENYLPDELPSKWIPDEVIDYPVRAIDMKGVALAGEEYDEIIELEQIIQK